MKLKHPPKTVRQYRFLILRRICQITILLLFLIGPWLNIYLIKGNLASSKTFDFIPLTDPFWFSQSILTGFLPLSSAIIGVVLVIAFYLIVGGKTFCSWVCPLNIVTDTAHWIRERFGIKANVSFPKSTRFYILAIIFITTLVSSTVIYETINPVHSAQRFIIFLSSSAFWSIVIIFFIDTFIGKRLWCGHLCPMGAFYSLLNHRAKLRIALPKRDDCDLCMDCVKVCPEPQVILPVLTNKQTPAMIKNAQCSNCARCVDICHLDVFNFNSIKKSD